MNSSRSNKPIVYALYVNGAILLAILVTLVGRVRTGVESATAQAVPDQPAITGGNGIFVMPCQLHPEVWGCYLLDTQRQTLTRLRIPGRRKGPRLVGGAKFPFRFGFEEL